MTRQELLDAAQRINGKLAALLEGEPSIPTLYALLALAVHCSRQSDVSSAEALDLLKDMFASAAVGN